MQFYDFTLYAFLAPHIRESFFTFDNRYLSYLMVFGIFACGYLARPIGALLFGFIGDKKGRSYSLSITIIIATMATFMIGLIPNYNTIGFLSPILLLCFRLLQGVAVSGEEGSAVVLLFEKYAFNNERIIGACVLSSVCVGLLLGTTICALIELLILHQILPNWGWRLPFLMALPLGGIATYLRYYLNDFTLFSRAEKNNLLYKIPIHILFVGYRFSIIYSFFIVAAYSVITSTIIVHIPYMLVELVGFNNSESLLILIIAIVLMMLLTPIFGKFFEKSPIFSVYRLSLIITIALVPYLFYLISLGNLLLAIISIAIFSILTSMISSTIFALLVRKFPYGIRCSGVSLSLNLSITTFSSTTPIALIFIEHHYSLVYASGFYIAALLSIFLLIISILDKFDSVNYPEGCHEHLLYNL